MTLHQINTAHNMLHTPPHSTPTRNTHTPTRTLNTYKQHAQHPKTHAFATHKFSTHSLQRNDDRHDNGMGGGKTRALLTHMWSKHSPPSWCFFCVFVDVVFLLCFSSCCVSLSFVSFFFFLKKTTVQSKMRVAKNSNFCSTYNRRAVPIELMKTNMLDAAGFPVTSKDKTIRPPSCSRIDLIFFLGVLRVVGFFFVSSVVLDESVYFLLKSLSHVHHAVFLIVVLLQRYQDVDSVVLQCKFVILKNLHLTKTCGICRRCAIFPKWFCNHPAWVGEPSAASPWPCCTFVAVRKFHVRNHGRSSFDDVTWN